MRDVVIVGGGLSGLVAAVELAKTDLDVTLIEVKRHLGGTLKSVAHDGTIFDNGTMALAPTFDDAWLASLDLDDALFTLDSNSDAVTFKGGTGQLILALQSQVTATRLMRMAVSSIGEIEQGLLGVCLENGIMFDAQALILAVPARYAERMFYSYNDTIADELRAYRYDILHRVSLVCASDALPERISNPPDMGYTFIHSTRHPSRVPDGYMLIQFGLRLSPEHITNGAQLIEGICTQFHLPTPLASHISYWAEADPISCYDLDHIERIARIRAQLPSRIALIGSDYNTTPPIKHGILQLQERIQQGKDAAQQILASR